MGTMYGYCRISTAKQSITRQIDNISKAYPGAKIITETYTGTKQDRPEWLKLLKKITVGDTIIFDSVSRMSRNASEGIEQYMQLKDKGINLIFIKEPYINTDTYNNALNNSIALTDNKIANIYIKATNKVLRILAAQQIEQAFEQAEKEVKDLQQRTKEGIRTARNSGKQIGRAEGATVTTAHSKQAKALILKYNKAFGKVSLNDAETMAIIKGELQHIARNTYYKYKSELIADRTNTEKPAHS
ncbi:MAG: recombinase family protein [Oscillospiraceae bacterium]|nr:recombinase family protein [Oscillospiraceae bacterium]